MIFGTLGETDEGIEIVDQIFLDFPKHVKDKAIVYTYSKSPSIWITSEDWGPYEGEFISDKIYYLVGDKYYPEDTKEITLWHKDKENPVWKRDIYEKGKLINTYYK